MIAGWILAVNCLLNRDLFVAKPNHDNTLPLCPSQRRFESTSTTELFTKLTMPKSQENLLENRLCATKIDLCMYNYVN